MLLSLAAWLTLSLLFSLYVENAANYSVIYGSIGAIIVLLLWLYLCGQILFLGIVFTSVWYHRWRGVRQTVHFPRREDGERSER